MMERFFLFAGDQKIEHLNKDFFGKGIPEECGDPEHLFRIASQAPISAFATQLGLIAHYGNEYKNVKYVVKLNSKTNLVPVVQKDPLSLALHSVQDVVQFKKNSGLSIIGVGYTVYLGSEYESQMLTQAAQIILQAHQNDLLAILWMYPRGKAIKDEREANLIAGAAGVAVCLGADFVKINPPKGSPELLLQAVHAAGKTRVLCAGGEKVRGDEFLQNLHDQISIGGVAGCAVGRNIYQRTLPEAVEICQKIAGIVLKKNF